MTSAILTKSLVVLLSTLFMSQSLQADLDTDWDLGERTPNFSSFYIDPNNQTQTATQWHNEYGADVFVVSTCAMWCTPCSDVCKRRGAAGSIHGC